MTYLKAKNRDIFLGLHKVNDLINTLNYLTFKDSCRGPLLKD